MIQADMVLFNGTILTMDSENTISESVAIKFDRFLHVGKTSDIQHLIGKNTILINLSRKTVIPGFIDSHSHFLKVGLTRNIYVDLSEEAGVNSISDIQAKLSIKARNTPQGEWIFGYQVCDKKLKEKRYPTRWELDAASNEHPIILSTIKNQFWIVNSKAFENAKITNTSAPEKGRFDRDLESGELLGGVHENAYTLIRPQGIPKPTEEQLRRGIIETLKECASVVLTCIYELVDKEELKTIIELKELNLLPIRIRVDIPLDLADELAKIGIIGGLGGDKIKFCGLQFSLDYDISDNSSAISKKCFHNLVFYGKKISSREIVIQTVTNAYEKGFRISAQWMMIRESKCTWT